MSLFKRLTKLFFILLIFTIFTSFIFTDLVFAQNNQKLTEEQAIVKLQKAQVNIEVVTPYREGFDASRWGSGTVIAKSEVKRGSGPGEDIIYYICTDPHVVHTIEKLLEVYKEARIRIYIRGKDNAQAEADIVAWNWGVSSLLLRAQIPEEQVGNFKFEIATIANELPISSLEVKFSDNLLLPDPVYLGGYPLIELADSRGKVSQYVYNEKFKTLEGYSYNLIKTMHIACNGLVGSGQSGGGIFIINKKTGEPEWVGVTTLGGGQLIIAVPVDVIVEEFLKQIPDLRELIKFPKFKLNPKSSKTRTIIYKNN